MTTYPRGAVAATLLVLALSGCSAAEDRVKEGAKDLAGDAACSVAAKSVSGVKGQVDDAIDQIGADPEAAKRKLTGLRDGVKSAEDRVGGDVKVKLTEAREALDELVADATDAAKGTEVDTSALESSKEKFGTAADDVTEAC